MEIGGSGYSTAELASAMSTISIGAGDGNRVSSSGPLTPSDARKVERAPVPNQKQDREGAGNEPGLALSSGVDIRSFLANLGSDRPYSNSTPKASGKVEDQPQSDTTTTDTSQELTEEEQAQVDELKQRDQEVRQHEQAHLAAGGTLVNGGAQFEFQTGPDGKQYAIGGHVSIDSSSESNPQATIKKAKQIQRAAMAPADPSPQDVKVAARAMQMMLEAQRKLAEGNSNAFSSEEKGVNSAEIAESGFETASEGASAYEGGGKLE